MKYESIWLSSVKKGCMINGSKSSNKGKIIGYILYNGSIYNNYVIGHSKIFFIILRDLKTKKGDCRKCDEGYFILIISQNII